MGTFEDPLGQYAFELPLGWGYATPLSHLITVHFQKVGEPEQSLWVRAVPTSLADGTEDSWRAAARQRGFRPETKVRAITARGRAAIAADLPGDAPAKAIIFRGRHIDVVSRHEAPADTSDGDLSTSLARLAETLEIPTDQGLPPKPSDFLSVETSLHLAADLEAAGDIGAAVEMAEHARVLARDTYLYSAHGGCLFPEVPAVVAVVDALLLQARARQALPLLIDAERLIARAAFALDRLPMPRASALHVRERLNQQAVELRELQETLLGAPGGEGPDEPGPDPPLLRRAAAFGREAAAAFERAEPDAAITAARLAMDELFAHQVNVQSWDAAGPVTLKDGTTVEPEVIRQVLGRSLGGSLGSKLRMLSTINRTLGHIGAAREANALLIDLAERLSTRTPTARGHFEPIEGQRPVFAAAILDQLASLILEGAEPEADVDWQLDEAQLVLEEIKEGAGLRARERFLRRAWSSLHGLGPGADRIAWVRRNIISALPRDCLFTLAAWVQSDADDLLPDPMPADVPDDVLAGGPAALIAHLARELPEHEAVSYFRATGSADQSDAARTIASIVNTWLNQPNWRRGWAVAALRALDPGLPLDHPGLLSGLDFTRTRLVQPGTLAAHELLRPEEDADAAPSFASSPFGNATVRIVLSALDDLVALQEMQPTRFQSVLADVRGKEHPDFAVAAKLFSSLPEGTLFAQSVISGGVGTAATLQVRNTYEVAEYAGDRATIEALSNPMIRVAARFGSTVDFLFAVHRAAAATMRHAGVPIMIDLMEHVRLGALWLGDAALEATAQQAIGLMLREGWVDGLPGVNRAIPCFQRAATLCDQLANPVGAAGALIDCSALLIEYADELEATDEGRDWPRFARPYIDEAMARLVPRMDHPTATVYLGEAYQNLARLQLKTDRKAAAQSASCSIALADSAGYGNLALRARETLQLAGGEAGETASRVEVIEATRQRLDAEMGDLRLFSSRTGLMNAVLDSLYDDVSRSLDTPRAATLLLRQIEADRGYTYRRWIGADEPVGRRSIAEAMGAGPDAPVLAVYCVTRTGTGLIVLDGDAPAELHRIAVDAHAVDRLVEEHLAALIKHGRARGRVPWPTFQKAFIEEGRALVAPLAPFVAAGRTICLVPHGALHAAALHTLSCAEGAPPIGLRVPVFVNPSIANWLAARRPCGPTRGALLATTCPESELSQFGEGDEIAATLAGHVDGALVRPAPRSVNLASLAAKPSYRLLHLASHGLFDADAMEMGLLLSRDGHLPPPPPRGSIGRARKHLVRPVEIYRQGSSARFVFLASCVSSRNANYPGDDLMGLTRAFFGTGTTDLVAGSWTVMSEMAGPFTRRFYQGLVAGVTPAAAMLEARRATQVVFPSPFFWAAFQHQGANVNPFGDRPTK